MCEHSSGRAPGAPIQPCAGERRRKLWELSSNTHCPVVGLCLPLAVLRRLVGKAVRGTPAGSDYDIHLGAVNDCGARNRLSELLNEALDQRYCAELHRFRQARDADGIMALWREAVRAGDVAGAFWAALTHPSSGYMIHNEILGEVHMIQHQAGAGKRVDLARHQALIDELAAQKQAMRRQARALAERARDVELLATQLVQARAALVARGQALAQQKAAFDELQASIPQLETRARLQERLDEAGRRERARDQLVATLRQELAAALQQAPVQPVAAQPAPCESAPVRLDDKTVLCVGGRGGKVPSYRAMIEQAGGRFAHHDGGQEDAASLLDASLAAADLVICQAGCISHSAYWRVKDHCKRLGKQCVFLDNPSSSSFSRGLRQIAIVQG